MDVTTSIDFIKKINKIRFQKNRDRLMKLVEEDHKLLAWIAWGMGLILENFSHKQMLEYVKTASENELKKIIVPIPVQIFSENDEGVILDKNFAVLENDKIISYLNIENQLSPYPQAEIQARSILYLCSILFWEFERIPDKKHYRMVVPASGLWIFPESSLKNSIDVLTLALPAKIRRYNFSIGQDPEPKILNPKFDLCSKVWLYYLGNPKNLNKQFFNGDVEEVKMAYLLLLLDIQFGFDIDKTERIKIAENIFGLGRSESNEVNNIVNHLSLSSKEL